MFPFDPVIFSFFHSFAGQSGFLDWLIVFCASYLTWILGIAAAVYVLRMKPWRRQLWLFSSISLTVLLSRGLIVPFVSRLLPLARPFQTFAFEPLIATAPDAAFPSGHAAFLFAIAFVLLYENRRRGGWFLLGAAIVAAARVIAGVHYATDVVGGALVALVAAVAVHSLIKRYAPREVRPMPPEPMALQPAEAQKS
jgi:undecaprenyl-diphosphatase